MRLSFADGQGKSAFTTLDTRENCPGFGVIIPD